MKHPDDEIRRCDAPYCRRILDDGSAIQYVKDDDLHAVCIRHWTEICEKILWILLIVPYFLLSSCFLERNGPKEPNAYTPNGYGVILPGGWIHDDFTNEEVLGWVDTRIAEWIAQRSSEYGVDTCISAAHNQTYELVDDFRFWNYNPPLYASGSYSEGMVKACLYTKAESADCPETVPYPSMGPVFHNGLWKWGVFPADGVGFIVIGHELDHTLLGHFH